MQPERRDLRRISRTARLLFGALLAWLVVYYNLQKTEHGLDGKGPYEPSTMEKIVRYLAK